MIAVKYLIVLTILLTSCVYMEENLESDWSNNMEGLAGNYNNLIHFLYDKNSFESQKNQKNISELIQKIVENSQNLQPQHQRQMLGSDPLFNLTLQELKNTSVQAQSTFLDEQFATSRYLLKNSILFCAQCHIHSKRGPEILEWDNFADISRASPLEQGEIYLATRQFTKAQNVVGKYINSSPLPADTQMLKGLKRYIHLAILRDRNPTIPVQKIDQIQKNRHFHLLSSQTQRFIASWKSDLNLWTESIRLQELPNVESLTKSSDSGRFISDTSFITALRNSTIYHEALRKGSSYDEKPIIYYRLGIIYDRYPEISAWELPESYFQACIFLRPHSKIAKRCYRELEERIRAIYQMNGSSSISLKAKQKLNRYKSISVEGPKLGAPRANFYNN